jgi:hypothetical protein
MTSLGVTYSNACRAASSGVNIKAKGECTVAKKLKKDDKRDLATAA